MFAVALREALKHYNLKKKIQHKNIFAMVTMIVKGCLSSALSLYDLPVSTS